MKNTKIITTAAATLSVALLLSAAAPRAAFGGETFSGARASGDTQTLLPPGQAARNKRYAKIHRGRQRGEIRRLIRTIDRELDLNASQREAIRDIVRDSRAKARRKIMKNRPRLEIERFMTAERFDKKAFVAEAEARRIRLEKMRKTWRRKRLEMMAETMEKIFFVLTPRQREKLIQLSKRL